MEELSGDEKMESLANRNLELQNIRREFLENHQLPYDFLEPNYTCKQCSDSGYVNGKSEDIFQKICVPPLTNRKNGGIVLTVM